eukprot:scaffold2269_cov221-Pinguiococcus_pyrenoidosus.AAC.2
MIALAKPTPATPTPTSSIEPIRMSDRQPAAPKIIHPCAWSRMNCSPPWKGSLYRNPVDTTRLSASFSAAVYSRSCSSEASPPHLVDWSWPPGPRESPCGFHRPKERAAASHPWRPRTPRLRTALATSAEGPPAARRQQWWPPASLTWTRSAEETAANAFWAHQPPPTRASKGFVRFVRHDATRTRSRALQLPLQASKRYGNQNGGGAQRNGGQTLSVQRGDSCPFTGDDLGLSPDAREPEVNARSCARGRS